MNNGALSGELMTLSETAEYLKVAEKTVLRLIHKKEIPSVKIASQWRFDRGLVDRWILSRMNVSDPDGLTELILKDPDSVPISRLIKEEFIIPGLTPGTRENVLNQLVRPLFETGMVNAPEEYTGRLIERENMMSTSLGRGVAMPHIRNPKENSSSIPAVVLGICREGTQFIAGSNELVYLFFFNIY